jgi:hypothetical protein
MSILESTTPDFFLASTEGYGLEAPRRCYRLRRVPGRAVDDYLVIRIDPPLGGQRFGLGDRDIDKLVIATRHQGSTLFPISEWPTHVHVARMLGSAEKRDSFGTGDLEAIGWGELYRTEDDARRGLGVP